MESIPEEEYDKELKVTFQPELYLQRRIWILNVFRKESVTRVLDVGCGEGQLLVPLTQPAPWLAPPPASALQITDLELATTSPAHDIDEIPNLHISYLFGLDISKHDLEFAARETAPPSSSSNNNEFFYHVQRRWEELQVELWEGGLEVINEDFVGIECIVSTEVIEHLTPEIFPAFAPMLLGVYHPRLLLITTPSYTYNARFTAPDAPSSARRGYPDPTGRTDRIFRHDDHKFEWTVEEFQTWCEEIGNEWGYDVESSGVGRAVELDPWNREEQLGDASLVACFRKSNSLHDSTRERRGRERIVKLSLPSKSHELHVKHTHIPDASARSPKSLAEIAAEVVKKMDHYHETFTRVEEVWFEPEVATACGGWIELLVRAIETSEELELLKGDEMGSSRNCWRIQRIGPMTHATPDWPQEGESSLDYIPPEWEPDESEIESAAMDGDVSWNTSELDIEDEENGWGNPVVQLEESNGGRGSESSEDAEEYDLGQHSHSAEFLVEPNTGWNASEDISRQAEGRS